MITGKERHKHQEQHPFDISAQSAHHGVMVNEHEVTRIETVSYAKVGIQSLLENIPAGGQTITRIFVVDPNGLHHLESGVPQVAAGTVTEDHTAVGGSSIEAAASSNVGENAEVRYGILDPLPQTRKWVRFLS